VKEAFSKIAQSSDAESISVGYARSAFTFEGFDQWC
jgi:hypothetical protein